METDLLYGLNEKQKEVVTTTQGYVRVIASAGSGKTKALTARYAYLVEGLGISAANILCLTFTNKAAQELKNRIRTLVKPGNSNDFICTFHGFCVRVLREEINKLSYPKSFTILDSEDQEIILREVFEELEISLKDLTFKKALEEISKSKSPFSENNYIKKYIEPYQQIEINPESKIEEKIFISYIKKQKKNFALDFDDLICFVFYIFNNYIEVRIKWQNKLNYIMVDESQDNNKRQWDLVSILCDKYKNLCVVGDPDQSIYEWRHATPDALVNFDKMFKPCKTIIMDENYRSTPDIINVANCMIRNNKNRIDKDMFTKKANGAKVTHFHGKSEYEEGLWVAQTILKNQEGGASLKDFAILYRASHVTRNIEQALINKNIPYIIYGGIRFFERKEIKDAISYLRLINNSDDFSFLRVLNSPKRKLGKVFVSNLKTLAENSNLSLYETLKANIDKKDFNKEGARFFINLIEECRSFKDMFSISDLLQYVLAESGLEKELRLDGEEERLENIDELMASIKLYEKENANEETISLDGYLQDIALYTNLDYKEETDFVKLMTIHQAKGLEFNYVFVCGMSEGIMPSYRSLRDRKMKALEEERRLAYVAITRAKEELFLTESEGYNFVNNLPKYPSRFIFEIKEEFLVVDGILTKELMTEAKKAFKDFDDGYVNESERLKVANKVYHPVLGYGIVLEVNEKSRSYLIEFDEFLYPSPIDFNFTRLRLIESE